MPDDVTSRNWWGTFRVPIGHTMRWRIGPLSLWIQRVSSEWRVAHEWGNDPLDASLEIALPTSEEDLPCRECLNRFVLRGASDELLLTPLLADRPVVTRSEKPIHLLPGEQVIAYVGSPLWVRISVGSPPVLLEELPVYRLSDTWFGPSTREGELCYASRTTWRLHLENVPLRPHRAITAVRIENRATTHLPLERLKLPAPYLALYQTGDGYLWTQDVTLEWSRGDDFAALKLGDRPPRRTTDATPVSAARIKGSDISVVRAFSSLFDTRA